MDEEQKPKKHRPARELRIGPLRIGHRKRERNVLYDEKAHRAGREIRQELFRCLKPALDWLNRLLKGKDR